MDFSQNCFFQTWIIKLNNWTIWNFEVEARLQKINIRSYKKKE